MILLRLVLVALLACSAIAVVAEIGDEPASADDGPAASPPVARGRGPPPVRRQPDDDGTPERGVCPIHPRLRPHPPTTRTRQVPNPLLRTPSSSGSPTPIKPWRTTIE